MREQRKKAQAFGVALIVGALAALGFAGGASAHTGEWAKFNNCPSTNPSVFKCIQSVTNGGSVVMGKKTVPIVNPVTLQGGYTEEDEETGDSAFVEATNGVTLSKTPQPVPGGLSGLVNCKEISSWLLRISCEGIFENGLTGVNATVELAKPASNIVVNQEHLLFEEGVALKLPVRVHLENPFLGSGCYIGSSSSPIIWNLTTGTTSPPAPNSPISGFSGEVAFKEKGQIVELVGAKLVDNAWSAPGANGCGGILFEWALNPIINSSVGVPAAAGKNTAVLGNTTISQALAKQVNLH
jgi:hypothetical protein